jgi:transcriptional regulator with XRE-family HTH domain
MISIKQIRAARALLDWTQADLARKSGVAVTSINNIETNLVTPRLSTLAIIQKTFEQSGVEFLEANGVRQLTEPFEFRAYEGKQFLSKLIQDILSDIEQFKYSWMIAANEKLFQQYGKMEDDEYQKVIGRLSVDERIIVASDEKTFLSQPKNYRWLPKSTIGKINWLVYGDRMAFIFWAEPKRSAIIRNPTLVNAYKSQFQYLWKSAKPFQ